MCFLLWNEVKRINKRRLIWRIFASVAAVVSLACTALPVTFHTTENISASKEMILLTEGFNKDTLRNFLQNTSARKEIYATDQNVLKDAEVFKPKLSSGIEMPALPEKKTDVIRVFGYGLKPDELKHLDKTPLVFYASQTPTGITAIDWQRKITAGDRLLVQGSFNNNFLSAVKLVLNGLSTGLDSIIVPPGKVFNFELSTVPKHLDRAVYSLFAIHKKDTIEAEDIPVEVMPQNKMQVCMLAESPNFENKFFANWLSQNGFAVAVRSRISRNKFQKNYVNISNISLDHISTSVLQKFDVMVADAAELASISKAELVNIKAAVQNKGLGLIVKADSSINSHAFYSKVFSIVKGKDSNDRLLHLSLKNANKNTIALPAEHWVYLRSYPGTQTLINNTASFALAVSTIFGNGKIVFTSLENTYSLLLFGNSEGYHAIWSLLLQEAAKKVSLKETVTFSPALPKLNEPLQLWMQSNYPMHSAQVGDEKIYFKQDKLMPFINSGTYWPLETGWLPYVNEGGETNWLYVYKNNDWNTLNKAGKLRATHIYAVQNSPSQNKNTNTKTAVPLAVPKIYFFLIFIASAGFLWFEKKFLS